MKKASLLFIFILVGLVFAQGGVRLSEPLDGTITTVADQGITYIFGSPEIIDPASIVLSIDGTHYGISDPEIFWSESNFRYLSSGWTDGQVVSCTLLVALTVTGDTIAGVPLASSFTVDLTRPYLVAVNPGQRVEIGAGGIVTDLDIVMDTLQPVDVWVHDVHSPLNPYSIVVEVDGHVFDVLTPGVEWIDEEMFVIDNDIVLGFFLDRATTDTLIYGVDSVLFISVADDTSWFGAAGSIDSFFVGTDSAYYEYQGIQFGPAFPWITVDTMVLIPAGEERYLFTDTSDDTIYCGHLTIDPAVSGTPWNPQDTIYCRVYGLEDIPDYGPANMINYYDPTNNWMFVVDAWGPIYETIYPIAEVEHESGLTYTSCTDLEPTIYLMDSYGLDLTTFSFLIRGDVIDITDPHIEIDTLSTIIVDGVVVVTECNVRYVPNPQFRNGETIEIELLAMYDILGNPFRPMDITSPWLIFVDRSGPYIGETYPPHGITTDNQDQIVWFDLHDRLGVIDPQSIHFIVESALDGRTDYIGWTAALVPEVHWDGERYTLTPEDGGWEWTQGDTVTVTAYYFTDLTDFCPANPMTHTPETWTFYVSNGPQPVALGPLDHEFTSCQKQPVTFTLEDPDGIIPDSTVFSYEGNLYTIFTAETTFVDHTLPGGGVVTDTIIDFPLVWTGTMFVFTPPDRFFYEDAQEIECAILQGYDALGNPMWGPAYEWSFIVDLTAPYVVTYTPELGSYAGGPSPEIMIEFGDDVSGSIDIYNTAVTINGINFGFDSYDEIPGWDPETNILYIDPSLEGLAWGHHEEVEVCITQLYDNPENRCDLYTNRAVDLPICWTFFVDNMAPSIALIEPAVGEYSACADQPIVIELTDDVGVDPSTIILIVESMMYTVDDPELTWDDATNTLTFTPPAPYADGEEVTFSLAQVGDVAGNILFGSPSPLRGFFTVDREMPTVVGTMPEDGAFVEYNIDMVTFTLDDISGINWESALVEVTIDGTVFDGSFGTDAFSVAGNTATIDLNEFDFEFLAHGSVVEVEFSVADNPEWECTGANVINETFAFDITPGWFVDIVVNSEDTIVMGAAIGAAHGIDELDVFAAPATPDFTPASFILDDGTRLTSDIKDIEVDSPIWQIWTGSEPVCITWNHEDIPEFGSYVINGIVDMRDESVTEFCAEAGEIIWINHNMNVLTLSPGWNLVSVPVEPIDPTVEAVYPTAEIVYWYNPDRGVYEIPEIIEPGKAYFVLYDGTEDFEFIIPGDPVYEYEIFDMPAGWNTIGSVYNFGGVDFTDPMDYPDESVVTPIYEYDTAARTYNAVSSIYAGMGYWAYVDIAPLFDADLEVSAWRAGSFSSSASIEWDATFDFGKTELTVGAASGDIKSIEKLMPPAMFNDSYTAWIAGDVKKSAAFSNETEGEWTVVVTSRTEVTYSTNLTNVELTLDGEKINGNGVITVEAGNHVLRAVVSELPTDYALVGNSPNPFNGATEITFEIPEESNVVVTVHDMMGKEIRTLINSNMTAGRHSVTWDAKDSDGNNTPTGVYFYKVNAGSFSANAKMLYVK